MVRFAVWALAALMVGTAALAQTPPATAEEAVALLQQAAKTYDDKKPAEAARLLKIVIAAPVFELLTPQVQRVGQGMLANAAYDSGDYPASAAAARAATVFPNADADDWAMRVWASDAVDDSIDAVNSMTTIAAKWPDRMKELRLRLIGRRVREAASRPGGEEVVARFMQALLAANWTPSDALPSDADWMWLKLVRFDLKWKQLAEAKAVAARLENPDVLRKMQTEKVFDEIVTSDPGHYDSDKAAERMVRTSRDWADAHSDQLDWVIYAALDLGAVDRAADALALLDAAQVRIVKDGRKAFKDLDDQQNWLLDTRSRALKALGRNDEALAVLAAGAKLNENGGQNVSQILNLAGAHARAGRPADTLATLSRFDVKNTSAYGRMVYESARACAYAQLQDDKGLKEAMTFVDAYSGDNLGAKVRAQLCANDIDGAVHYLIAQLQTEERRSDVIAQLQTTADPKLAVLQPFQKTMRERYIVLRQRPDLLKALEPYGRAMTFKTIDF